MPKKKLPIWMTDWTLQNPKNNRTTTVTDFICKGWTAEDIINNEMLVNRVRNKSKVKRNKLILIPIHVKLKSQHGFGPDYEDEKSFSNEK